MAPIQKLDREWAELATSPRARRALLRWANTKPDLSGNRDLAEVLTSWRDRARSHPVLIALDSLAPEDDIAARTLLQAVLPGLITLAAWADNDDEAALDEMLSLAWERIRAYRGQRTCSSGSSPGQAPATEAAGSGCSSPTSSPPSPTATTPEASRSTSSPGDRWRRTTTQIRGAERTPRHSVRRGLGEWAGAEEPS